MYGAFWCSHCYDQKQMFGKEAMAEFPYVECYPEGWKRGAWLGLRSVCAIWGPNSEFGGKNKQPPHWAAHEGARENTRRHLALHGRRSSAAQGASGGTGRCAHGGAEPSFARLAGVELAPACKDAGITGFPTWVLADGQRIEGERTVEEMEQVLVGGAGSGAGSN